MMTARTLYVTIHGWLPRCATHKSALSGNDAPFQPASPDLEPSPHPQLRGNDAMPSPVIQVHAAQHKHRRSWALQSATAVSYCSQLAY
jgi:hypothetical protein